MKLVGYSKRTQDICLYADRKLTKLYQTSPDQITKKQLRDYLPWSRQYRGQKLPVGPILSMKNLLCMVSVKF